MLKKLREPVNSLTHWAGAILALDRVDCPAHRRLGHARQSCFVDHLRCEPDIFIFSQRHLSHGARKRQGAGDLPQDRPCRNLFSDRRHIHAVLHQRFHRLLEVGHVDHYLVAGVDRYRRQDIHHPRAALVECGHLSRHGLAVRRRKRTITRRAPRLGFDLAHHRRRDLHPWRNRLHYKNIQLCTRRVRLP